MIDQTIFSINIWDVFQKEGKAALENGDLEAAATDFSRALEKAEGFGKNDPRIATSKRYLANVYHKQGKDEEAEKLLKEALELLENELGYDSNALVKTLIAYKSLLKDLGRMDEVDAINNRLMSIRPADQDLSHTTDVFEIQMPPDPETAPMTAEQEARIRELLKSDVPTFIQKDAEETLKRKPSFKAAYELEETLRKVIVKNYD